LEPEELPEVVAPGRALVRLGGGDLAPLALGLFRERAVHVADLHPVRPPVLPFRRPALDFFEIVDVDAVGGEPRLPVAGGELDLVLWGLRITGRLLRSTFAFLVLGAPGIVHAAFVLVVY